MLIGEGISFQSQKYGEIKGWKPDRCQSLISLRLQLLR